MPDNAKAALEAFVDTIEATGGLIPGEFGMLSPAGDPTWSDLGSAYLLACAALGRKPMVTE